MEFKPDWESMKRRVMGWLRDMILVFGMWSIWLVRGYMIDIEIKNVITGFLIVIISITVLKQEYFITIDNKAFWLEKELERQKKLG